MGRLDDRGVGLAPSSYLLRLEIRHDEALEALPAMRALDPSGQRRPEAVDETHLCVFSSGFVQMQDMSTTNPGGRPRIQLPRRGIALAQEFEALARLADAPYLEWAETLARSHLEHYEAVFEIINRVSENNGIEHILDVGAVPGYITVKLKRSGFETTTR